MLNGASWSWVELLGSAPTKHAQKRKRQGSITVSEIDIFPETGVFSEKKQEVQNISYMRHITNHDLVWFQRSCGSWNLVSSFSSTRMYRCLNIVEIRESHILNNSEINKRLSKTPIYWITIKFATCKVFCTCSYRQSKAYTVVVV